MAKRIFQIKAKLIKNIALAPKYYKIVLSCAQIAPAAEPGQFVSIKVSDDDEPLLRRPFSIHRISGSNLEILYEVVGEGTLLVSSKKAGEFLDVIGPLGKGFDYRLAIGDWRLAILVAGGMGVAPLLFLAQKLITCNFKLITVLIGAQIKSQILCEKEFKDLGCDVKISTDDGSKGFKGKVTDLLKYLLRTTNYQLPTIYACGPGPMLKEISRIAKKYNIPAQISLEEHMACGIGACLGCAVETRQGYKRVCKEGPVFKGGETIW